MATTTKMCPKCGSALTPAAGEARRWACKSCGVRFGARPAKAAVLSAAAPGAGSRNELADLAAAAQTPSKAAPAAPANARPAGGDPRLKLALLVGCGLVVVFLGLIGVGVLAVVLWARSVQPPVVALLTPPTTPIAAEPVVASPALAKTPAAAPADPVPPPKKPAPPAKDPPLPPAPPTPPLPPAAPPELKPVPDPMPASDPTPAPAVKAPPDPIHEAIDKAVDYLKSYAHSANSVGVAGLTGLALMESDVPADDPAVAAAVATVRGRAPACARTYEMAIAIWCLDRLDDPKDEDLIRDLAARLIAGQLNHGKWTYTCPQGGAAAVGPAPPAGFKAPPGFPGLGLGTPAAELTSDQIKDLMETLAKYDPATPIPAKKQIAPVCRFVRGAKVEAAGGAFGDIAAGDLSLTQFAVLGLWVARKHHVPVDRSLLLAEAYVRANQGADGGWSYTGAPVVLGTTDSMTCSGMLELAIGRGVLHSEKAKTNAADPQFEKGLVYLADLFTRGMPRKQKDAKGDAQEESNLAGVGVKLQIQLGTMNAHAALNQHALWLKELTAFQEELGRSLALALPPDAKKDLQEIADQIKSYKDAPAEKKKKEKEALEQLLAKSSVLQSGGGVGGVGGFRTAGPGKFIKPGKSNRFNMDDIYCLWSLERLCMVCDLKTVAGHDWYAWGADLLVANQNGDGSWSGPFQGPVDTSLALLFLKRVNVAKDLTAQLKLIAPIKDLSGDKLKLIGPGTSPSPGETPTKSPGETTPSPKETPKR